MKKLNTKSYITLNKSDEYPVKALLKNNGVLVLKQGKNDLVALSADELETLYGLLNSHYRELELLT